MELGGTGEGVGQGYHGRWWTRHFPREQVLATFPHNMPHCQPLFGCAELGTKAWGMTKALRSREGGTGRVLGVNHLLLFVGDCPHHHRHPLCYCCYSLSLRLVSLSYFAFFETIPGGGAQRESWGGGQKASKPTRSQDVSGTCL